MPQNSLQRGNELTPVIPGFTPVIPGFTPVIPDFILVIPDFILVIPAKAGIHTDSPPEPYCPVPPWPCHPREGGVPLLGLDSRFRGNDDFLNNSFPRWSMGTRVLRHPLKDGVSS
ncbi:hypothetical protein [Endozoicomonas sp. 8E]|uniref:hypothetical protein n=1 Tax=Endozoicomonas sp. 8E TaxID=3035692 RepID=UPI002938E3AA|nr:hypothetical protein [Endozoicomonas sp. 8E]WOG29538.1 hypothetical protein P6910_07780 [Endozoicomonas sp. 8E]